jgi:putative membrane protein
MRFFILVSGTAIAFPALAQIGNPAGWAPDTLLEAPGVPAPNQTNTQDRLFARLVAAGGLAEVELGKLAAGKARSSTVKEFASRMIDDHTSANEKLMRIAEKSKIPLPTELDKDHQAIRDDLEKRDSGFDLAYMRAQVVDHQKTAQLMEWEVALGEDAELQRFAAETLPTVLQHLEIARILAAELSGQALAERAP